MLQLVEWCLAHSKSPINVSYYYHHLEVFHLPSSRLRGPASWVNGDIRINILTPTATLDTKLLLPNTNYNNKIYLLINVYYVLLCYVVNLSFQQSCEEKVFIISVLLMGKIRC